VRSSSPPADVQANRVAPTYTPGFIEPRYGEDILAALLREVPWINKGAAPRDECFMALDTALTYSYGKLDPERPRRTYSAAPMHPLVRGIMQLLNAEHPEFGGAFNVCVLNHYANEHQHLGWHADDSPEQDPRHAIAVVSFGAVRGLWTRPNNTPGAVPPENRYRLTPGSLFVMPAGYQATHQHRIPKHDRPCGSRVSLTFRKLDR